MDKLIDNIVAPVDFSEPSARTVRYAAALANRLGATLHLVHVLETPAWAKAPSVFSEPTAPSLEERLYHGSRAQLLNLATTLGLPDRQLSVEVRTGPVAESITQAVVDYGADLVIMSTHGRSALSHLLMGSVAEQVIRTARCPVLVMRDCGQVHVHVPHAQEAAAQVA